MAENFGQYSYPQYPQYPQQGNFNGNPAMIPIADKAIENAQSTGAGQVLSDFPTTPDQFIKESPYIAVGAGVGFATKALLDWGCGRNTTYESSPMRRLTSRIDNSAVGRFLEKVDKNVIDKVKDQLLRIKPNIKYDAAEPSFSLAKGLFRGAKGNSIEAFVSGLKELKADDITKIKKSLTTADAAEFEKLIANKKLPNEEFYKGIKGLESFKKVPVEDLKTSISRQKLFKFIPMPDKKINLNLNHNRVKQLEGEVGKSYFTRFLPKSKILIGETLTGGLIGGPVGIIINAIFLGHSFKRAADAPKGEKLSTFMEDFWGNQFTNMVVLPIAGKFIYDKVIGLKYLGSSKEAIKSSIEVLDGKVFANKKLGKLGENTVNDKLIEKIAKKLKIEVSEISGKNAKQILEHLNARNENIIQGVDDLKLLKKGNLKFMKNPIQWALKRAGNLLGVGLDRIPGKFGNRLKGVGGGALRFGILMFGVMPVLTKLFMTASHAIFGKPTNSLMDQDKKEEAKEAAKEQSPLNNVQNQDLYKFINKAQQSQQIPVSPAQQPVRTNVQNQDLYKFINKAQQPQQIPVGPAQQPVRTYVPQTTAVVTSNNSVTSFDKAFEKSDRVMERADKVLKNLSGE